MLNIVPGREETRSLSEGNSSCFQPVMKKWRKKIAETITTMDHKIIPRTLLPPPPQKKRRKKKKREIHISGNLMWPVHNQGSKTTEGSRDLIWMIGIWYLTTQMLTLFKRFKSRIKYWENIPSSISGGKPPTKTFLEKRSPFCKFLWQILSMRWGDVMWCEEADTVLVTCGSKLPPTALWDLGDDLNDP